MGKLTFILTDKQRKKFINLLDKDVQPIDAYKKVAPEQCKDVCDANLKRRIQNNFFNRYPDIKEAYRRLKHRKVDRANFADHIPLKKYNKGTSKTVLNELEMPHRTIEDVTEGKTLVESIKQDPIKEIQKAIALREAPPDSQDIYNMGRAMLLLAFTEIEARRQAIIELGKSPLDKDGSLFSYTIVPVIKCAVDMMLPFVRDKQNNVSESIMAAEIIKRSIAGFKENPDDYTAPIPDGVDTNAN